jgi:hypothetical protein
MLFIPTPLSHIRLASLLSLRPCSFVYDVGAKVGNHSYHTVTLTGIETATQSMKTIMGWERKVDDKLGEYMIS